MTAMPQTAPAAGQALSKHGRAPWPVLEGGWSESGDPVAPILQALGTPLKLPRNAAVFSEGEPARQVYKVIGGAVRSCRVLRDGRRQIAHFHLAGEFFGLDWQGEHGLTAEAVADAVVVSYPRAALESAAEDEPALQKLLMNLLAGGLAAAQDHVVMLGRQTAQERLAWFLLGIMRRSRNNPHLELPMGRLDIADYLGLTIETVSRGFSQFRRDGLITVSGVHRVALQDVAALQSIAGGGAI
jgi:CRP/FNR family nitrogen fixation transcriptional regulator